MRNYLINGAFDVWPTKTGTTPTGTAMWSASRWLVGPGYGGVVKWSIEDFDAETAIPGNPRYFLRLEWLTAPTQGENPPNGRFTFLENHGLRDARQLHGCWVDVTFWLRLASGTIAIVPIAWANYINGDYAIFSGEAFPVRAERGWHPMTQSIWIPPVPAGKGISLDSYLGFGLDFLTLYGPKLDIACATVHKKEINLTDPQLERVLAESQFWN